MKEKDLQTISASIADKIRVLGSSGNSANMTIQDFINEIEVSKDFYNFVDGNTTGSVRGIDTAEEDENYTMGEDAFASGTGTKAVGTSSHAEGYQTVASGDVGSHAEGANTEATNNCAHAEGSATKATNIASHAEGSGSTASGLVSHAEGSGSTASGTASHSEGGGTTASGATSHAEGGSTKATAPNAHSEGGGTEATAENAHAEGGGTHALGIASHAEGNVSTARGVGAHSEGAQTIASGDASHAEGNATTANGENSHASGFRTEAFSKDQFVIGRYNVRDVNDIYAFIVGNGTDTNNRSNAFSIKWDGTIVFADGTEMTPAQFASIATDFGESQIQPSFIPSSSDSQYNRICKAGRICKVEAYLQFSSARTIAASGSYTAGTVPNGFRPMKNTDHVVSSNQNVIARIKPDGDVVLLNNSNTSQSVSNFFLDETYITP